MKISKYTLKFVALGKDRKTYLRYYCTVNGKGETYNMDCNISLTAEQLKAVNDGVLGGIIQDSLYEFRAKKKALINKYALIHNTNPPAEHLKLADKSVFSTFNIDYYVNQYLQQLDNVKPSTKRVYSYNLQRFKTYYFNNLNNYSIADIINENTVIKYGAAVKYIATKKKNITPTHIYNYQVMLIRFLNYVAKQLNLPKIDFFLKQPAFSSKWHIDEADVNRLLKFKPTTTAQQDVLDIININKKIGLRIGEILNIQVDNVTFDIDACYIRFLEEKKSKERTVVVIDKQAIEIIQYHISNNKNNKYLWRFNGHNWFNTVLQEQIAKDVFKEETIKIYKNTVALNDYDDILKWKAISSHTFRRFAIERNIVDYGIDVARSLSGHKDTAIMFKHYADFMKSTDLKNKLLKK